jgi:hypothetical protein
MNPAAMSAKPEQSIDWSQTTWKGHRLQQHREFHALSFRRKLEVLEEMCEQGLKMLESRRKAGLPYIDPFTGEVVRPERAVAEETATPPPSGEVKGEA